MARVRGCAGSAEMAKKAAGGIHLKLDDGESVTIAFAGFLKEGEDAEPLGIEVVWTTTKSGRRSEEYDPAKHSADEVSTRFLWNVYVRESEEMKVWTQGPKFLKKWMSQKNKDRMGHWFELERDGLDLETEYTLAKQDKISEDELADIVGLDLHDLDKAAVSSADDDDDGAKKKRQSRRTTADAAPRQHQPSLPSSNGAISAEVAASLRQAIKDLPDANDVFERFKAKFSITKLKDLPVDQEQSARAWLDAAAQLNTAEPAPAEVDPFE